MKTFKSPDFDLIADEIIGAITIDTDNPQKAAQIVEELLRYLTVKLRAVKWASEIEAWKRASTLLAKNLPIFPNSFEEADDYDLE